MGEKRFLDESAKCGVLLPHLQGQQPTNHTLLIGLINSLFQLLHIPLHLHHLLPHHVHLLFLLIILRLQLQNKRFVLIIDLKLLWRQLAVFLRKMCDLLLEVLALLFVLANWWRLTLEFADPLVDYLQHLLLVLGQQLEGFWKGVIRMGLWWWLRLR